MSEPIFLYHTFYYDRPKISAVVVKALHFLKYFSFLNFWYIHATEDVDLHTKKLGFFDLISPEWHEVLSYFYNSHSLK